MPEINFVNPVINNITDQEISIQVSLGGFSFLIRSTENKQCLAFRNYEFKNILLVDELIRKAEQIISEDNFLNNKYKAVDIYYISQHVTIIPQEYFSPENLKTYFEFNHNLAELDELHYTYIQEINAYNVFSIPSYLSNAFYNLSSRLKYDHQSSQLIRLGHRKLLNNRPLIILGVNKGFFDLVVFERGGLVLSNSFQYANTMDFVYFYLYALKQLKIDGSAVQLFILGNDLGNRRFMKEIETKIGKTSIPEFSLTGICQNFSNLQAARFYTHFF